MFAVGSLAGENKGVGCVGLPAVFTVYSGYTVVYCIQCLCIVITVYSGYTDSLLHTVGQCCVKSLRGLTSGRAFYAVFAFFRPFLVFSSKLILF